MLGDEITLTLNSPLTDEQFDMLTDADMENTPRIVFRTKSGKEVEYIKPVRCKDCVHKDVPCPLYGGSQFFCAYGDRGEEE